MRLSEFRELINDEFGASYAETIVKDLALTEYGDRSGEDLIMAGEDLMGVWLAICNQSGVPNGKRRKINKSTLKK